ncbi:AzlC family ABC transporter permease [Amorphus orientalis]|uniref:Branched-subunit amino acid permease n=1 Tax=Amorphus orientalis TaxID=649198 RepID=A0AAE4ATB8_9HYPH|nr:AzlC family ABC transporter permease [Amorphus orientalis]MDQ0317126.1 putative branched-subunit amino acid permease [Amorphus orientalis]
MVSIPALVLMAAQVGFAALARDAGLSLVEMVMVATMVWALPAQIVFVGSVLNGAGWLATALAISFSSIRFLPMLMAWTPVVRDERTSKLSLLAVSTYVAVTSWVFSMSELPKTPRHARLPYFAGFAAALLTVNLVAASFGYLVIGQVSGWVSAVLLMMTPLYFLLTMSGAGRVKADHLAMIFGLVIGPVLHATGFDFDILVAGLVGGTLAYLGGRFWKART